MRLLRTNTSGQILILSALAIVVLLISTVTYIYQLTHYPAIENSYASVNSFITNIEVETQYLLTQLLALKSQSDDNTSLTSKLTQWGTFVTNNYYQGYCALQWILSETPPYSQGVQLVWGTNGSGISSTQITMKLNLTSDATLKLIKQFTVLTQLSVHYEVTNITDNELQVVVTATLQDESGPALTDEVTIYYHNASGWHDASLVSTYTLTQHHNGTYTAIFHLSSIDNISVQCIDHRGIYVQANATHLTP